MELSYISKNGKPKKLLFQEVTFSVQARKKNLKK